MSALPPPGLRPRTKLPGEPSAAVLAGREIFERAWVFAVSIDSPDEQTIDDAGRKVASLVRELMQAQMEAYCAAVCPDCRRGVKAELVDGTSAHREPPHWNTVLCKAFDIRETWRKGIWADGIE